ncbi:hypothetical protein FUA48_07150 [Flavobacterium alkalisoli]|uniref:Uncharacterized protein n=1 Tax=Flavobacterium alkalisoli TaxID=2602769 RepID=A0A5B9FX97_9FLAO|nr:hypothetical protein [Flavobacterium alkalisoli]QEE49362.1 hypothetical protein FUA48_07150 [Flavobacterium alkalisoli]
MKVKFFTFIAATALFVNCKSSQQITETESQNTDITVETEETNEPVEPKYESPKNKSLDSIKAKMSTNLPKKG